eukprot:g9216.t1
MAAATTFGSSATARYQDRQANDAAQRPPPPLTAAEGRSLLFVLGDELERDAAAFEDRSTVALQPSAHLESAALRRAAAARLPPRTKVSRYGESAELLAGEKPEDVLGAKFKQPFPTAREIGAWRTAVPPRAPGTPLQLLVEDVVGPPRPAGAATHNVAPLAEQGADNKSRSAPLSSSAAKDGAEVPAAQLQIQDVQEGEQNAKRRRTGGELHLGGGPTTASKGEVAAAPSKAASGAEGEAAGFKRSKNASGKGKKGGKVKGLAKGGKPAPLGEKGSTTRSDAAGGGKQVAEAGKPDTAAGGSAARAQLLDFDDSDDDD